MTRAIFFTGTEHQLVPNSNLKEAKIYQNENKTFEVSIFYAKYVYMRRVTFNKVPPHLTGANWMR